MSRPDESDTATSDPVIRASATRRAASDRGMPAGTTKHRPDQLAQVDAGTRAATRPCRMADVRACHMVSATTNVNTTPAGRRSPTG
jgi:hypothetical protein